MRGSNPAFPGALGLILGLWLLVLALVSPSPSAAAASPVITGYRPWLHPFLDDDGLLQVALRRYERAGKPFSLVLDPRRFRFRETALEGVLRSPSAGEAAWRQSPFFAALEQQTAPPFPLRNDGLRRAAFPVPGYILTVDLCPSGRPLDRRLFEATAALPQRGTVPIALMISGRWIRRHPDDLAWLKNQTARLAILWGNHSLSHPYDPAAPLERNFLLTPGSDPVAEALGLERLLIEKGLMPSPFFRFPGLVSDRRLVEALRPLGLIPVGSDAWLAKGEKASPGSIILVHGNGNEPEGLRRLRRFYDARREAFLSGEEALLPLPRALIAPAPEPFFH